MSSKKKDNSEEKNTWLGDVVDDLTYLEINTIVKKTITAEVTPEFEDVVTKLFSRYKERIDKIIGRNEELSPKLAFELPCSYEQLSKNLDAILAYLQENQKEIRHHDYAILLRINRFLDYLKLSGVEVKVKLTSSGKGLENQVLYKMDFEQLTTNDFDFRNINPRVKAKFRRMYDMNAETIVMQTRFGIDGDVTSRIATDFSEYDKDLLLKIHEKHTNLSLTYWKELVHTVTSVVGKIFDYLRRL